MYALKGLRNVREQNLVESSVLVAVRLDEGLLGEYEVTLCFLEVRKQCLSRMHESVCMCGCGAECDCSKEADDRGRYSQWPPVVRVRSLLCFGNP